MAASCRATASRSCAAENGLATNSAAPSVSAVPRPVSPVQAMTGTRAVAAVALSFASTCQPSSLPGRERSTQTTAGGRASARASPAVPVAAVSTSSPSSARPSASSTASSASSSITSTCARLSAALARQALGSSNQNVLPAPSSLSNPISPPCAATISWQSARPSPVPPIARVSEESARKNRLKTCFCWFGRDAETGIRDADACKALARRRRDRHGAAGRRVLDGVREQIRDHLADAAAVADHRERLVRQLEDEPVARRLGGEQLDLLGQQGAQLERLERECEAPGFDPLDVEEIVDQLREAPRLPVHVLR